MENSKKRLKKIGKIAIILLIAIGVVLLCIWLFLQRNRSSRLVLFQNLFSIFQHQLCHYINAAVKRRIIFRIIIDFAQ